MIYLESKTDGQLLILDSQTKLYSTNHVKEKIIVSLFTLMALMEEIVKPI